MRLAYSPKYMGYALDEFLPTYHPDFSFEEQCEELKRCVEMLGGDVFEDWYEETMANVPMPDMPEPDEETETEQSKEDPSLVPFVTGSYVPRKTASQRIKDMDVSDFIFDERPAQIATRRKAYSYIRMSTETQLRGDSLRRQLEASEQFAQENDLQLVDSIDGISLKDIGVSAFHGANSKDGILAKFLEHLEQRKIAPGSVLLIESLDRLSRAQVLDALSQFINIVSYDIEIITLTDNQRYTKQSLNENPAQLFVSLGVMFRANEESATKSKRLKASWHNKRNQASTKPITSVCPAWLSYSKEQQKFIVIEEKAKVVRTIFEMCAHVCGQGAIAKYLNQNNVPVFGRSKYWILSYIKKIIMSRAVLGEFQPGAFINGKRQPVGDVIPDYFPRIIDDELFNLAHAALKRRKTNGSGRKGEHFTNLFANLAYCGSCGGKIFFRNRGWNAKKNPQQHLACHAATLGTSCKAPEWNYASVERRIISHLQEVNFSELLGNINSTAEIERQLISLNNQLREKQEGFEKLLDLVASDDLHEAAKPRILERINKASDELAELTRQVEAKQHELDEQHSQQRVFNQDALKQAITLLEEKKDDYYFRSSVHQLLSRAIARIDLIVEDQTYAPWEIEEDDSTVERFLKQHPELRELPHEKLVERKDFKVFWMQFENRIRITYKTGVVRQVLVGRDVSFDFPVLKKQYRDAEKGHFITEEEAKQRELGEYKEVLVKQAVTGKAIR